MPITTEPNWFNCELKPSTLLPRLTRTLYVLVALVWVFATALPLELNVVGVIWLLQEATRIECYWRNLSGPLGFSYRGQWLFDAQLFQFERYVFATNWLIVVRLISSTHPHQRRTLIIACDSLSDDAFRQCKAWIFAFSRAQGVSQ